MDLAAKASQNFFLNINKPRGKTAHDVVYQVRKLLKISRVGHGGTLDPMAEGVLPIAVGKCTRLIRFLVGTKTYKAGILLGQSTTTDDIEGRVLSQSDVLPDEQAIRQALNLFSGKLEQLPPDYSAVHYQGKRLYQLARVGQVPEDIKARSVEVYSLDVVASKPPHLELVISCSAGTYIRSIARDLGAKLGCGGCLESLVRTAAGPFVLESSVTLEELAKLIEDGQLASAMVKPSTVLGLPNLDIKKESVQKLVFGQTIHREADSAHAGQSNSQDGADAAFDFDFVSVSYGGDIIAVCRSTGEGNLQPEVVMTNGE
jgi:tRNA pseudouridine55 synthase